MSQAEGGRGDGSGGAVAQLRTRSNWEETESQPGDWEAENREEHRVGRKGQWVRARELRTGREPYTELEKARRNRSSCAKKPCEEKGAEKSQSRSKDRICLSKFGCFNCPITLRPCVFRFP